MLILDLLLHVDAIGGIWDCFRTNIIYHVLCHWNFYEGLNWFTRQTELSAYPRGSICPPSLKEILVCQYFYMHNNAGYIVGIGEGWVWIISPFTSCHQCKWMPGECAIHLIWKLQISTSTEMTVPRPSWRWAGMRPAILNKLWPPVTYHG